MPVLEKLTVGLAIESGYNSTECELSTCVEQFIISTSTQYDRSFANRHVKVLNLLY